MSAAADPFVPVRGAHGQDALAEREVLHDVHLVLLVVEDGRVLVAHHGDVHVRVGHLLTDATVRGLDVQL